MVGVNIYIAGATFFLYTVLNLVLHSIPLKLSGLRITTAGRISIIGVVHSLVTLGLLSPALSSFYQSLWASNALPPSTAVDFTLALTHSAVFFLVDLFPNWRYNPGETRVPTVIHHIASSLACTYCVLTGETQFEAAAFLVLMEFASPFMCLNMLLKDSGDTQSTFFQFNEWIFELLFLFNRCVIAPWFTYRTYQRAVVAEAEIASPLLLCCVFIHLFTALFAPLILQNIYSRLVGRKRPPQQAQVPVVAVKKNPSRTLKTRSPRAKSQSQSPRRTTRCKHRCKDKRQCGHPCCKVGLD